jgi:MFS family permease
MFTSFTALGVSIIVFGLSSNLILSVAALMVMGMGDIVATVIRQTLVQMQTPDEMRGRVFSVNSLFYGTSSQIGAFRAGLMAEAFGAVASVVIGGACVVGAVALWAWLFPGLRRVDNPALVDQGNPLNGHQPRS